MFVLDASAELTLCVCVCVCVMVWTELDEALHSSGQSGDSLHLWQ